MTQTYRSLSRPALALSTVRPALGLLWVAAAHPEAGPVTGFLAWGVFAPWLVLVAQTVAAWRQGRF